MIKLFTDQETGITIYERDHKQAFRDALKSGVLTMKTVGEYMYMYTDAIKGDAFKNITTRKYIFNKSIIN
tara:strand:+ start:466 stop:675 length:210 start_codon:yes stop_codon:yes gene_type:complete